MTHGTKTLITAVTKRKGCMNCVYCSGIFYDVKTGLYHRYCSLWKKITENKLQRGCTYFDRRNTNDI